MENTFKSSVFGGFNRDDVIRYIEKTSLESKQQIEALEQESDGLCRENAELRDKLAAAERERDKLAESYSTASSAQDALKKGLTAAQETISELRAQIEEGAQKLASAKADCDRQLKANEEAAEQRIAELEAQHAERLSAAEQERKRLLSELDELRPQVEEYGRVKAHIADIELSARERADHRIVMATTCAALGAEGPSFIDSVDHVGVSFPRFYEEMKGIGADIIRLAEK